MSRQKINHEALAAVASKEAKLSEIANFVKVRQEDIEWKIEGSR